VKKIPLILTIAGLALTAQSTRASTIDQLNANSLVLTENSSTSLTATYTTPSGSTSFTGDLFQGCVDCWVVNIPPAFFAVFDINWAEPENPIFFNVVTSLSIGISTLIVASDTFTPGVTGIPNGTTVENVGFDVNNGLPINLTFFDNAATAEGVVPDTGSTVGLLFLSLAGLFGAARVRSLRFA
jgi:hypothetical protein